ncbi:MAG: BadF/BadG/BcrA/BcrD ATPase family protein [candidate division KSB1 bacterium]
MPSPNPTYILGIDSGGTEMRGCLLRNDGLVLARQTVPSANYNKLRGDIVHSVVALAQLLCEQAKISREGIALAGFCATGVGRLADRQLLTAALQEARLAQQIVVESDALAALTGAFAGEPGIIVSAGTGAIAHARTHDGKIVRVGGWGYLLGDEGSGYYLAKQALNAALKDWDGRGAPTQLRAIFEKHFNVASIELIITQIYDPAFDRGRVAELAPLVFGAAEAGDLVAQHLVEQTGSALGELVAAALKQFEADAFVPLALLGKLFRRGAALLPAFCQILQEQQTRLQLVAPRFDPVIGSALLALQTSGRLIEISFLNNLEHCKASSA